MPATRPGRHRRGDSDTPAPGGVSRSSTLLERALELPHPARLKFCRQNRDAIRSELMKLWGDPPLTAAIEAESNATPNRDRVRRRRSE